MRFASIHAQRRPDFQDVAARLAERMPELARVMAGEPMHRGRTEWRFRSKGSLAVVVGGPKRGAWHDHEAGQGGDALGLVAHLRRLPMRGALEWALAWLGDGAATNANASPERHRRVAVPERPRAAPPPSETLDLARRIWREALPADAPNSLAPRYLAGRGLAIEPGAPLRFHPECPRGAERWPAMLALMTDPASGEACGVHRTFLARDGGGKAPGPMPAKMMAGRAGVVRLVPCGEVTAGLGIAEGIETGLSVMQGFRWRPVWAATSAGAIRAFPVLPGVEALTLFSDPDGAGLEAAERCAARWAAGREVRVCRPPAGDFNDMIRRRAA